MSTLQSFWGKDKNFTITITDQSGRVDLGGKTLRFTAKKSRYDPDPPLISKITGSGIANLTQAGATLGQATISIDPADTVNNKAFAADRIDILEWDCDLTSGADTFTVDSGTWEIDPSVTEPGGRANSVLNLLRDRIRLFTDYTSDPALTEGDIDVLLQMSRRVDNFGIPPDRYAEWSPGTQYAIGDQVSPFSIFGDQFIQVKRNGYYYTCSVAGKTGTSQPVFPTTVGATVTDGTATWTCSGTAPWNPSYDVNYAIAQGWLLKTGRLVGHYNYMANGKMLTREQMYTHCMKQYRLFSARTPIRGIRLGGHHPLASVMASIGTNADG